MIDKLKELSNILESRGFKSEAKKVREITKNAGQIPAGMHRFILDTGQFGGSSYDETDWLEEEAKKIEKKRQELLKSKKKSSQ